MEWKERGASAHGYQWDTHHGSTFEYFMSPS
jgi:hypothetical protein